MNTSGVGVNRPGAFAEYLSIPVTNVWYCDRNIPMDILSCFDPLGNATHTALSFDLVGEDVLITGAGPIGIMAAMIAHHCGARNIVITDINAQQAETVCQDITAAGGSAEESTPGFPCAAAPADAAPAASPRCRHAP